MITAIGSLGTVSERSTDRSTSCAVSRAVAVGRVVVAWLAVDSTFSIFTPTDGGGYWYATDSAGNIYTTIASFTDDNCFHGCGGQAVIAIAQLRNALTTSDTVTFQAQTGLEVGFAYVRDISLEEFDFGGDRWAVSGVQRTGRVDNGVEPQGIGITFNTSREWLLLHGLANEGPDTDSFTWDSDYTEIVPIGTNSGTPTDDMTLRGGYRIATLSTDGIDISNDTSSTRDSTQILVGVCAAKQKPGFPVSPILDDFNRADEYPLSAAAGWDDDSTHTAFFGANAGVTSNRASGAGGSFWDTEMVDCVEVYAQMAVLSDGYLTLHGQDSAFVSSMDGNAVGYLQKSQDAIPHIEAGRVGLFGAIGSPLMKVWATTFAAGNWIGMQRTQDLAGAVGVNHVWVDIGDGWEEVAAYVIDPGDNQGEFRDGRLALTCADTIVRWDNFGGGQVSCGRRFKPDYYRRRS